MVSRLYKIKSNNAVFIVYVNFSMIPRLPSGKATRNKETMRAKYIYTVYIIYYFVCVYAHILCI